jgi:hypothetical protein
VRTGRGHPRASPICSKGEEDFWAPPTSSLRCPPFDEEFGSDEGKDKIKEMCKCMTSPGPKMLSPLPLYLSEWALPSCLADHGASLEAGDQRFPDEKELSDSDGAPPSARAQGPRMGKDLFFAVAPGPDLASSKDLVGRPAH